MFVINTHANAHGVDLRGIVQINNRLPYDLVVGDVEINGVVRAETGGAPVDLHHFGEAIADLQPVADLVRTADLQ